MTSTRSQSPVEIDPAGDLILKIVEDGAYDFEGTMGQVKSFKVSRRTLLSAPDNDYWKRLLDGPFAEASRDEITIEGDTIASMELWLRAFHDKFIESSYALDIAEIWGAISVSEKYMFHLEKLESWFADYWKRVDRKNLDMYELRLLLLPCQKFCHGSAFAYVSKRIVYESDCHIYEDNLSTDYHLQLEGRVMQQLNAARSSMRTMIVKALLDPLAKPFCLCQCKDSQAARLAYLDQVQETDIWPLFDPSSSIKQLMSSAAIVRWRCVNPPQICLSCRNKLSRERIEKLQMDVEKYWHGLCLDCMNTSMSRTLRLDSNSWLNLANGRWDKDCSIHHGRNSRYFSFMGPEIRTKIEQEQKERKKKAKASAANSERQ